MIETIFTRKRAGVIFMSYFGLVITLAFMSGCSFTGGPRGRAGYLPTDTHGIKFTDPSKLGQHSYGLTLHEVNGIIYTCKAGHLDLGHVRGNADNTRYLFRKLRKALTKNAKGFSFSLTGETSSHKIQFTYPQGWENDPNRAQIIDEIAYATAPYLSHQATVWHEILTWFGVHFMGIEPEFNSAFSWEDMYSNVLGTQLGVEAMKTENMSFDKAMTVLLDRKLEELNVQPREVAIKASDKVRDEWYKGIIWPDMLMRNMDIGMDGSITPLLIPGIEECSDAPLPIAVPTLDVLKKYGLTMTHRIKPKVLEQGRIYKAAGTKKIYAEKHFPVIMQYIKKDATEKGYKYTE